MLLEMINFHHPNIFSRKRADRKSISLAINVVKLKTVPEQNSADLTLDYRQIGNYICD